jgi:glycerol-1-phosphate dehydrogenase [NAD(P)+]
VTGEVEACEGSLAESARVVAALGLVRGDATLAVIGLGGGRALDVAKHAAASVSLAFVSVPTSLSNDGFASPTASLTDDSGRRTSVACGGPAVVVVDTAVCAAAPPALFASGVGDVAAKLTALADWELAEHAGTGKVDGVAAAIARASIELLESHPLPDEEGQERLARALLLGGVAMSVAGSSRPCSGSEHLISHALDRLRTPPGSHGLQVMLGALIVSRLQGTSARERLSRLLDACPPLRVALRAERPTHEQLAAAVRAAPTIKDEFVTVLSRPGAVEEAVRVADDVLAGL